MEEKLFNLDEIEELVEKIASTTDTYQRQVEKKDRTSTLRDLFFLYGKVISLITGYLYATTDLSSLDRKDAYLLHGKAFHEIFDDNINKEKFEPEETRIVTFIHYGLNLTKSFNVNLTTSSIFKDMFNKLYLSQSNIPPENFLFKRKSEELDVFNEMFEKGYNLGKTNPSVENDIKKLSKAFEHFCRNR